ncbi:hypothetical protein QF046_000031 [Microbacterium sp. W4I4]|uniref:hypothetical protein n=1 Tax=Microbacterium sp. W4I4 TaxID=3042295 RepID=UPI0027892B55|nr:hypothetical protein [Microbacterium sp. W4I4]MDQ0612390.1 hypothetical protein [Microbacterium sp. W4I4]
MTAQHPSLDDPELGRLVRGESVFDDGTFAVHDWYVGSIPYGDSEIELMIDGTDAAAVQPLLPRLRTVVADLDIIRRTASDAVVTQFSDVEPEPHELDEGAQDLRLEAIEATADGTFVLHFADTCGEHFPDGYWPAAHLDGDCAVTAVTVES